MSSADPKKPKKKLTVAELLSMKNKRKLVLTTAFDEWTAAAAEAAGVDMILAWGAFGHEHSKFVVQAVRKGAPNTLIGTGINPGAYESHEKALQLANEVRSWGTDIVYCSGLVPDKFATLARQHFPCCGHVGYLPCNDTWYGGPRAVGKTAEEALKVFDEVMALEKAGCVGVEMEVVPARVAKEISKRTKLLVFSMGSGVDCDGQFIFSEDILGTNSGHIPRHARGILPESKMRSAEAAPDSSTSVARGCDFFSQAVKALTIYREEVLSGGYPTDKQSIKIPDEEFDKFMRGIESREAVEVTKGIEGVALK